MIRFDFEDRLKYLYYLLDFYKESDESSQSIYNTMTFVVKSPGCLDVQNITAFGADNASVIHGNNYFLLFKFKN